MNVRLRVRARAYDDAAAQLVAANHSAAQWYDAFADVLSGYGGMAGDDATSTEFAAEYDACATEAMGGLRDLVAAAGNMSVLLHASGSNHRRANRDSVWEGPVYDGDDPLPEGPVEVGAYTPPTSEGGDNEDLPEFWNHIQDHLEGFAWPNADVARLREAATAWTNRGSWILGLQDKCETAMNQLEGVESPEIPMAVSALQVLRSSVGDVAQAFVDTGAACTAYADEVENQREVIKGILRDLAIEAGITAVASGVLSFVTFGGSALAGGAIAGWRITAAARKIIRALQALKAAAKAGAVAKLTAAGAKVRSLRVKLERFARARKVDAVPQRPQRVNGKLPKKGEPGSYGYDDAGNRLPYANSRPDYGPDQIEDVWDNAKDANGDVWVLDENGNRVKVEWTPGDPRKGVWDMGHNPGSEYRDLLDDYLNHKISKEEFLERYRDPDNYTVQHPTRNQSHIDEAGR
ncbi:HNH/ENDO VII family nuclease [Nocardioides sp. SYSU DS0651]|uniref:HNH/ENDO VII family nuclease n=1 Tax=Nocardioides sp. SYSU DS0651 TaxID=3415955 RepID=UPI003F4BC89B